MDYHKKVSLDGVFKYLFKAKDGKTFEAVYIPQKNTSTICLSSQVGCALGCKFCATGYGGFSRNITAQEIIAQYENILEDQEHMRIASSGRALRQRNKDEVQGDAPTGLERYVHMKNNYARRCYAHTVELTSNKSEDRKRRITKNTNKLPNIVFMGMGEPLLNLSAVAKAIEHFNKKHHLAKKKITISTIGIPEKLAEAFQTGCRLALSLHAQTDETRKKIMPIAKKYSLDQIFTALQKLPFTKHNPLMIEYLLIKNINDQEKDANEFIALLQKYPLPYLVNIIPYNEHPYAPFKRSEQQEFFRQKLISAGFKTFIRESRGEDIEAACGLLRMRR